ncbi:hypothetical protein [Scytonema sp. PCC 10023]|uniref:hypothetical protein n=1 Tax=Scytonema sp. PCC 10023 TaxID=1680591 RepID=UPI0039C6A8C2
MNNLLIVLSIFPVCCDRLLSSPDAPRAFTQWELTLLRSLSAGLTALRGAQSPNPGQWLTPKYPSPHPERG